MPSSAQLFTKKPSKNNNPISLKLSYCDSCGSLQILNKPVTYYKNVIRTSNLSNILKKKRIEQFNFLKKKLNDKSNFIEIGSGAGENIEIFSKFSKNVYGIENSSKNYLKCKNKKLNIYNIYPNNKINQKIKKKFDAFFIYNFLEHIPNIKNFFTNIKLVLKNQAMGIIEVPNFEMIKKKNLYTEIIKDHLLYFDKQTLRNVLIKNGFQIIKLHTYFDQYIISALVKFNKNLIDSKIIKPKGLNIINIKNELKQQKIKFNNFFKNYEKNSFIIWGAGHQSLTFISHFKLLKYIKYIVDSANFKQNLFAPGSNLKIYNPEYLEKEKNIKNILIIAGGYNKDIINQIKKNYKKFNIFYLEKNIIKKSKI